jgi:hypothetical protein
LVPKIIIIDYFLTVQLPFAIIDPECEIEKDPEDRDENGEQ